MNGPHGTTKYPDTAEGVVAMLNAESTLTITVADVTIYPDPQVEGVWKVEDIDPAKNNGVCELIAYLCGYPNPMGTIRHDNDWECGYADEDDEDDCDW